MIVVFSRDGHHELGNFGQLSHMVVGNVTLAHVSDGLELPSGPPGVRESVPARQAALQAQLLQVTL